MQTLIPVHELDQLSTTVERAANAAAECVRQVSIRDLTQTDIATGAEGILFQLGDVTEALRILRKGGDARKRVNSLKRLEHVIGWMRHYDKDLIAPAEKTVTDEEVCKAVAECRSASRGLTGQIKHVLALDEVRGAGLNLRAKAANDRAQTIMADLRKR